MRVLHVGQCARHNQPGTQGDTGRNNRGGSTPQDHGKRHGQSAGLPVFAVRGICIQPQRARWRRAQLALWPGLPPLPGLAGEAPQTRRARTPRLRRAALAPTGQPPTPRRRRDGQGPLQRLGALRRPSTTMRRWQTSHCGRRARWPASRRAHRRASRPPLESLDLLPLWHCQNRRTSARATEPHWRRAATRGSAGPIRFGWVSAESEGSDGGDRASASDTFAPSAAASEAKKTVEELTVFDRPVGGRSCGQRSPAARQHGACHRR